MKRAHLLIVTALFELGTGLLLLFVPAIPLTLLLGVKEGSPEALWVARIAGAALLTIGVACWLARRDNLNASQVALLIGVLLYDVAAAGLLAFAGLFLNMTGLMLWPGVVLHTALAVWCGISLVSRTHECSNE
jgi:hypothetical protein